LVVDVHTFVRRFNGCFRNFPVPQLAAIPGITLQERSWWYSLRREVFRRNQEEVLLRAASQMREGRKSAGQSGKCRRAIHLGKLDAHFVFTPLAHGKMLPPSRRETFSTRLCGLASVFNALEPKGAGKCPRTEVHLGELLS